MQEQEDEKCLSIYDTHRFLESCKNTRYYELFFILLHTGLRIGEALALEWCDLDFKHEKLRVYKKMCIRDRRNGQKVCWIRPFFQNGYIRKILI